MSDQQWVVDAYTVTLAAGMLGAGSTGDRFGARRIYLAGLLVFAAGSLLCALAPSLAGLVAARAVQGVGAALPPCSLALIVAQFPRPAARARALDCALGVAVLGTLLHVKRWRGRHRAGSAAPDGGGGGRLPRRDRLHRAGHPGRLDGLGR